MDGPGAAQPRNSRHQPADHLDRRAAPGSSCIRWTGPADGEGLHIDGVHVWNFTEVEGGVRVGTEETHTGPQVDANVPMATELLRQGLDAWLRDLKAAAEALAA